jgi:hypothetical protein
MKIIFLVFLIASLYFIGRDTYLVWFKTDAFIEIQRKHIKRYLNILPFMKVFYISPENNITICRLFLPFMFLVLIIFTVFFIKNFSSI